MKISKKYHFYYAHRNELLKGDKCERLHGHVARFKVFIDSDLKDNGVSFLFNDIDKYVQPIIKWLDHKTLVNTNDKDLIHLKEVSEKFNKVLSDSFVIMPFATSAENMARYIFTQLKNDGLPIFKIEFMETESSTVIYEGK